LIGCKRTSTRKKRVSFRERWFTREREVEHRETDFSFIGQRETKEGFFGKKWANSGRKKWGKPELEGGPPWGGGVQKYFQGACGQTELYRERGGV